LPATSAKTLRMAKDLYGSRCVEKKRLKRKKSQTAALCLLRLSVPFLNQNVLLAITKRKQKAAW
jgi:hypothetical protein